MLPLFVSPKDAQRFDAQNLAKIEAGDLRPVGSRRPAWHCALLLQYTCSSEQAIFVFALLLPFSISMGFSLRLLSL
ncbi:MAG: hypothetical protein JJT94_11265 [Bernardetiaceae bacterium]|nr:hypothetical protein [Bernardetiaceae bacterium]